MDKGGMGSGFNNDEVERRIREVSDQKDKEIQQANQKVDFEQKEKKRIEEKYRRLYDDDKKKDEKIAQLQSQVPRGSTSPSLQPERGKDNSQFDRPELLDTPFIHIILATIKYADNDRRIQKLALEILLQEAPSCDPQKKLMLSQSGVFEDLAGFIEGRTDGVSSEIICRTMDSILKDNKDGIPFAINKRVVTALCTVLQDDISVLKRVHLSVIARLTVGANDNQRDELVQHRVLPSLCRMLSHPDPTIQNDAVIALNNLVLGGARRTANATIMAKAPTFSNMTFDKFGSRNATTGPLQQDPNAKASSTAMMSQNTYLAYLRPHPYFNEMDTCGGIDRLFDIYTHTRDKLTERNCAVCIGRLFRARILPLKFSPVIDYLKTSSQETEKSSSGGAQLTANAWNSIGTLVYLAGKESNHSNILRDNYLQFLVNNLRSRHPKGAVHFTLLLLVTMIKAGMVGTIATFGKTSQNDTRSQISRAIPLSALRALAVPPPAKSSAKKTLRPGEVDDDNSPGEDDEVTLQAKALLEELK